jgi:DnaJ family protein A protein 5
VEDLEWALAEGNDDPEVFECVPCGKSFKSEASWNSHERSKKHIKNVEVLRRQMAEESIQLGISVNPSDGSGPELAESNKQSKGSATPPIGDGSGEEYETPNNTEKSPGFQAQTASVEETLLRDPDGTRQTLPEEQKPSKRDKRRLREAKKQAKAGEDAHVSDW